MAAGDVAELVRDHPLNLVGAVRRVDQAGVEIDHLPACNEGVDRRVVDQHHVDIAGPQPRRLDQRIGKVAQQRLGLRIAQDALRHRGLGGQRESDQQRDESGQSAPQRKVRRDAGEVRDHAGMLAPGGLNVS